MEVRKENFRNCPGCLSFRSMVKSIKGWLCTRCFYVIPYYITPYKKIEKEDL